MNLYKNPIHFFINPLSLSVIARGFIIFILFVFTNGDILSQAIIVPTPKQVLGYELGDKYSSHANIEKYILALERAAPNKVKVLPYGETYEGRTLYLVVFASPENFSRLNEIKSNSKKLSDPRTTTEKEKEQIIKTQPAIVWLSYNVHGNEASSSEAALNVMYQLASRSDEEVNFLFKNLVIVIDPLLNPDGHERYVNFQTARSGMKPVEDVNANEHNEDWPRGRTNHYLFDLNRDWAWLTQKESQARVKVYQEWKPQVHVDYHEMGHNNSYFFFPAFKPINKNFPKSTMEWGEIYGKANAAAFDAKGWSYWSGESFDLFYPGYGDSWPSLNGAIGMTYEQAGQVGVRVFRSDETILTLKDRLEHHSATSFATMKATAENKEKRLRDFYQFFKDAIDEGTSGSIKSFIVKPEHDPSKAAKMISLLQQQGVEVQKTTKDFSVDGLQTYFKNERISKKFPSGSYVINLNQPSKRLIMTLMEQEPALSDTFFYDVSAWTLPVAYGVETYWSGKTVSVNVDNVIDVDTPKGAIIGNKAAYAYVFQWNSNNAVKALAWLLQHDFKVNVAMKEFFLNGEQFSRGAIIVPVSGNGTDLYESIKGVADKFHIEIYSAMSGFTEHGINLGSEKAVRLKKPKIIVITNSPVGSESFGALWSMFDVQYGINFVPMKLAQLRNADLHDYTTLIFPDDNSNGNGYKSQIDSEFSEKIKTWVEGGGTFIGIEGGAAFASMNKISSIKIKEKKKESEKGKDAKKDSVMSDEEKEKRMTVEEKSRKQRLDDVPGTMLRVKLDNSHPLGFGYDSIITVFKTSPVVFELSDKGYNAGMYTKSPRLSGYISKENEKKLEESPFLVHEQVEGGNIILFTADPNFRLFWDGLNMLFLNSVLLMPSIHDVTLSTEEEHQ